MIYDNIPVEQNHFNSNLSHHVLFPENERDDLTISELNVSYKEIAFKHNDFDRFSGWWKRHFGNKEGKIWYIKIIKVKRQKKYKKGKHILIQILFLS